MIHLEAGKLQLDLLNVVKITSYWKGKLSGTLIPLLTDISGMLISNIFSFPSVLHDGNGDMN